MCFFLEMCFTGKHRGASSWHVSTTSLVLSVFAEESVIWDNIWAPWTIIVPAYVWVVHSPFTFTENSSPFMSGIVLIGWSPWEMAGKDPPNLGAVYWLPWELDRMFSEYSVTRIQEDLTPGNDQYCLMKGLLNFCTSAWSDLGRWTKVSWPDMLGLGRCNSFIVVHIYIRFHRYSQNSLPYILYPTIITQKITKNQFQFTSLFA